MNRMKTLVKTLNEASRVYYQGEGEIMSNFEYDKLYDELLLLETTTGIVLPDSPTQRVGYEVMSKLEKATHKEPALSLDKTKSREDLALWLEKNKTPAGSTAALLSWKMDGLTVVATYENGKLVSAVTRGDGIVGEIVTHNARYFRGLPKEIQDTRTIRIRGEAVILYSDFEKINDTAGGVYKNPRNLASASVRQLDAKQSAAKKIHFFAFDLVNALELGILSKSESMHFMENLGIQTVDYEVVSQSDVVEQVGEFEQKVETNPYPTDGLVLALDDLKFSESLGMTGKYPRHSYAFKWKDEEATTTLRDVEWSASRTGLINPIAVFDPVELEGTTVSRAALHNVSLIRQLKIGIGDTLHVIKSNMIIPMITANETRSNTLVIPNRCPVCGEQTKEVKGKDGSVFLMCHNPKCEAKKIKKFVHFVGRDYMNIVGLSESTLEKLIGAGLIHHYGDLFRLDDEQKKVKLLAMEGFQKKSVENLLSSIEKSRSITFRAFFAALGIPGAGRDVAKILNEAFEQKEEKKTDSLQKCFAGELDISSLDGIGEVKAASIQAWWREKENQKEYFDLLSEITISDNEKKAEKEQKKLAGKVFVVTGKLERFKNREELVKEIEKEGGKVSGSVSKNTDFLINNDTQSQSSKNKKAKELGIPIINEEDIAAMLGKEKEKNGKI